MTRVTLALAEPAWRELQGWLAEDTEVAGVLTARVISDDAGTTMLGRHLERAADDSYLDRQSDGLSLGSPGWLPAVRSSRADNAMSLFVHTHPWGRAQFSDADDVVDAQLYGPFIEHAGVPRYGSLIIAGRPDSPSFAGRTWVGGRIDRRIDSLRVIGDRLTVLGAGDDAKVVADVFERQLRALGHDGQRRLARLRVGIVGAGGTGSPIAEQLIRLGVGSLHIIDDDEVTPATVARGYGSGTRDVGRPKVDLIRDLADQVGFGTAVETVRGNITQQTVARTLRHCDVVFCCADGHAARVVLNRWAYAHLAPVIDVAVLISSMEGRIAGVDGRVTWLAPGAACLLCRGRIDPVLAYAEQLDPAERRSLAQQGYAPELDEPQPSVVTYTTLMAGYAVTELLSRLFGLSDTTPTEVLVRILDRYVSLNRRAPRPNCFCQQPAALGRGLNPPYLDLSWAS